MTQWEMLEPSNAPLTGLEPFSHQIQQVEPVSKTKATDFLRAALQARVDGEGAEQYGEFGGYAPDPYTSTSGAPFDRFEIDLVRGPVWPFGWIEFKVRMFAKDGGSRVERHFVDRRQDGQLVVREIMGSDDALFYGDL